MSTHTNSSGILRPIVRRAAALLTAGALSFAGVTIAAADVAAAQSTRTTGTSSTYSSTATYGRRLWTVMARIRGATASTARS